MASKKKKPKQKKVVHDKSIKLQIVLCTSGESHTKSFPRTELIDDPLSISHNKVVLAGKTFAEYLMRNCSGNYLQGMREALLHLPKPEKDDDTS